ncbi:MAG TPA: hypothetical protein VGG35_13870 [Streptosporangiaceae bacterium]
MNLAEQVAGGGKPGRVVAERGPADVAEQGTRNACLRAVRIGCLDDRHGHAAGGEEPEDGNLRLDVRAVGDLEVGDETGTLDAEDLMFCGRGGLRSALHPGAEQDRRQIPGLVVGHRASDRIIPPVQRWRAQKSAAH